MKSPNNEGIRLLWRFVESVKYRSDGRCEPSCDDLSIIADCFEMVLDGKASFGDAFGTTARVGRPKVRSLDKFFIGVAVLNEMRLKRKTMEEALSLIADERNMSESAVKKAYLYSLRVEKLLGQKIV